MARILAIAAAVVAVLGAVDAQASPSQEIVMQDDGLLQRSGLDVQGRALDEMRALGVTTVRVLVGWRNLAPDPAASTAPAGFDAADPATYPPGTFDTLDALVRGAHQRHLEVLLSPTGAVPDWASECSTRQIRATDRNVCRPDPDQFGSFVQALGRHFSGDLAVRQWSLWNEPNLESWLSPQFARVRGRRINLGAVLYRDLAEAGITGLKASGHGGDRILLGETAPTGQLTHGNAAAPGRFVSRLLCLDDDGRPLDGGEAARYDCRHPHRLAVSDFAHHPYTQGGFRPATASVRNAGEITLGYIARLERILARAERYRRLPRGMRIWNTEFGFQTDPPDPNGMSPARQATALNQAEYLSWLDRHLRSFAQYNLADDADTAAFNTGLIFNDQVQGGARKPAYDAFRTPIYVSRASRRSVLVWGAARPAGAGTKVAIQSDEGAGFATVSTVTTGRQGYFRVRLGAGARRWRLQWTDRQGALHASREARVDRVPEVRR